MRAESLLGKPVADILTARAVETAAKLGQKPFLAIVQVGDDEPSNIYVEAKRKACEDVGFHCEVIRFREKAAGQDSTELQIIRVIDALNANSSVHGVLVQLPVPFDWGINIDKVLNRIDPRKDIDCLTSENMGSLMKGHPRYNPCTVQAVLSIIDEYEIGVAGEDVAIIGRSKLVGMPLACVMMSPGVFGDATVHVVHEHTRDIWDTVKRCTLVVTAVGKEGFSLTGDRIRKGAYVIDVGIRRDEGKVVGDCEDSVWDVAESVTPVPGGVGPVTVAAVLRNLAKAAAGLA